MLTSQGSASGSPESLWPDCLASHPDFLWTKVFETFTIDSQSFGSRRRVVFIVNYYGTYVLQKQSTGHGEKEEKDQGAPAQHQSSSGRKDCHYG